MLSPVLQQLFAMSHFGSWARSCSTAQWLDMWGFARRIQSEGSTLVPPKVEQER